jgi:C1A family cysteine protease
LTLKIKQYGWVPDLPDNRDHLYATPPEVLLRLPPSIDLRPQCPPVYNQGQLGSCTANAIGGAVEFDLIKEKQKRVFIPSRLFLYYNERAIEGTVNADSGAQIRDGIKSVASQGDCPENLWPYDITKFAVKPTQQCYQQALKYKAVQYQRLTQDLNQLKGCLASGYPFVLGFTVYASFESQQVAQTGHANMPLAGEQVIGGHAVVAVGYDDSQQWFILRNSWGDGWGMKGYFTLPYTYLIDQNLSSDFWTIRVVS